MPYTLNLSANFNAAASIPAPKSIAKRELVGGALDFAYYGNATHQRKIPVAGVRQPVDPLNPCSTAEEDLNVHRLHVVFPQMSPSSLLGKLTAMVPKTMDLTKLLGRLVPFGQPYRQV